MLLLLVLILLLRRHFLLLNLVANLVAPEDEDVVIIIRSCRVLGGEFVCQRIESPEEDSLWFWMAEEGRTLSSFCLSFSHSAWNGVSFVVWWFYFFFLYYHLSSSVFSL